MAEIIIMPKLGFNMDQGKIVSWFKTEGEQIEKGEPLFSIETDKTVIDIEATTSGIVRKILVSEGDLLDVTLPIAIIGDRDENIDTLLSETNKKLHSSSENTEMEKSINSTILDSEKTPVSNAANTEKGIKITPRARKYAAENGIDLGRSEISGTGYKGGICEKDLILHLENTGTVRATPLARKIAADIGLDLTSLRGSGPSDKITRSDVSLTSSENAGISINAEGKVFLESIPYSGIRKVIGDRLSESKFTAPHLYFTQKINMEKLLDLRKEVNSKFDIKTSVTDFIAKAVIMAISKYPDINSSLKNNMIEKYKTVNLGIAVAAPSGLIVPNIKNSEKLSVVDIASESRTLIEKARNGKLSPSEYSGGTFTISNLGMFGIENFTAIINPPESGILSVSSTKDEPWVVVKENGDKTLEIKPVMNITLTVDHRLIDGLIASQFVTEIKNLIEHPVRLVI